MDDAEVDAKLAEIPKVDYDRIGERMFVEMIYVNYDAASGADKYVELVEGSVNRRSDSGCEDAEVAKAALEVVKTESRY